MIGCVGLGLEGTGGMNEGDAMANREWNEVSDSNCP